MDRESIVLFLRSEIEKTMQKLEKLAEQKASADGPRTSWHSQIHLDIERDITQYERYLSRCRNALSSINKARLTGYVCEGSMVTLDIGEKIQDCLVVEDGGGTIGDYNLVSFCSPIGKAIQGKQANIEVEVTTPQGKMSVKIIKIY